MPTLVGVVGTGRRNAERGLTAVLEHFDIAGVAAFGVAAGLVDGFEVADTFLVDRVRHEVAGSLVPHLPAPSGLETELGLRRAPLVTVDRVLVDIAEKELAAARGWMADMESLHFGRMAQSAGVPWCVLRAVSDTASARLPLDFNRSIGRDGNLQILLVLRELLNQPSALPGLLRLGQSTSRAVEALARAAEAFLPHWYDSLPREEGIKQAIV